MNDFTKEELEVIRHALRMDIANGGNYEGHKYRHKNAIRHELAFNKIQSMIDNYCEHPVLEGSFLGFKCMGCQEMFYDNQ